MDRLTEKQSERDIDIGTDVIVDMDTNIDNCNSAQAPEGPPEYENPSYQMLLRSRGQKKVKLSL